MTSDKKSPSTRGAANRLNAQRSTGPRSKAGKRSSSRNALKHGLNSPIAPAQVHDFFTRRLGRHTAEAQDPAIDYGLDPSIAGVFAELDRVRQVRMGLLSQLEGHASQSPRGGGGEGDANDNEQAAILKILESLDRYDRQSRARLKRLVREYILT